MATTSLGLFDLLSPSFVVGVDLGDALSDALNFLQVTSLDSAWDETGTVVWGQAKFGGGTLPRVSNVFDFNDMEVSFRLTYARAGSTDIQAAVDLIAQAGNTFIDFVNAARALGTPTNAEAGGRPAAVTPSDYASSRFRLEVLCTSVTLNIPGLVGAQLDPTTGGLKVDPARPNVKIILPRISFDITQDNQIISSLGFQLNSWGAQGLDDAAETAIGNLIEMQPPYALLGSSAAFGFGFQRAVLDLSDRFTPPELLAKFGIGTDWQGIWLPEVRIFVAPPGLDGWQVAAATRDLLIGVGATPGISGDFEVDVIHQAAPLAVQTRFYTPDGQVVNGINAEQAASPQPATTTLNAMVALPPETTLVVDVHSGLPPYTLTVTSGGGVSVAAVSGHLLQRAISVSGSGTLTVQLTDSTPGTPGTFTLTLSVVGLNPALPVRTVSRPAQVTAQTLPSTPGYAVTLIGQTLESATLQITPTEGVSALLLTTTLAGSSTNEVLMPSSLQAGRLTVPVPAAQQAGDGVTLEVSWSVAGGPRQLSAYFPYDDPDVGTEQAWSTRPDGTSTHECSAPGCTGSPLLGSTDLERFLQDMPAAPSISLTGYASFEPANPNRDYNLALSQRRAEAYRRLLETQAAAKGKPCTFSVTANGNAAAEAASTSADYDRAHYWRADAEYVAIASTSNAGVLLVRPTITEPLPDRGVVAPPPEGTTPRPSWFRYIRAMVRIAQGDFIAAELRGEVDFQTAAENSLAPVTSSPALPPGTTAPTPALANAPGNPNAEDGVVDYSLQIARDAAIGQWRTQLTLASGKNDTDGLLHWTGPTDIWRDFVGIYTSMGPLLSATAQTAGTNGAVVALMLSADIAATIAAFSQTYHLLHVPSITLYGAELLIRARDTGGWDGALFFDVETALVVNLTIAGVTLIQTNPQTPIKVRYKALGIKVDFGLDPQAPALTPVFDASRGYSLNISDPGTLQIPPPLDNLLQVLGTRIARTNPLNLELDVGLKADLGVVKVDRVAMRIPLDPPGIPTLSGIGVGVDIPGALTGKGFLKFTDNGGFSGAIDLTITPIKLRVAAGIVVEPITDPVTGASATSVFFTIEVDFPAPIVLGTSGLGLYGLAGLFGMHRKRDENPSAVIPALDWFDVKAGGNPGKLEAWKAAIGSWAFGVGAVLGTLEGAIVFNLKGMLLVELPGPRILIFMNAKMFSAKPDPKGVTSGGALAVIDLDFARGYIQIGLKLNLELASLITLMIPVDIFFNTNNPADFRLDLGTFQAPASALILGLYKATGYLMIHGNGIDASWPGPGGPLTGFAIALGYRISMLWGSESSGLYLKAWSSLDVGVGFSPFRVGGTMSVGGALHLWVVSIEASAKLDVIYPPIWVHGKICGKVDLFFFTVEGCVEFTLGQDADPPDPPLLFRGMVLQSRSPALLQGTGTDRPIDGSLGTAQLDGQGDLLKDIPIDAIPVLQLEMPPDLAAAFTTNLGSAPGKPKTLTDTGWIKRGRMSYRYTLTDLSITAPLVVEPGQVLPMTWRTRKAQPGGEDTNLDLALLDWSPVPTPKALTRSGYLQGQIKDRWITVCFTGAPPTSILWTFQEEAVGPSPTGWTLEGTAWPDPPDTVRSSPPDVVAKVNDPWRIGNAQLESQITLEPSRVIEPCRQSTTTQGTTTTSPTTAGVLSAPLRLAPTTLTTAELASAPLAYPFRSTLAAKSLTESAEKISYNSRMLQGPYQEGPALVTPSTDVQKKLQDLILSKAGFKATEIEPMVRIETGPIRSVTLLLLIPQKTLKLKWVVFRARDEQGGILLQESILTKVITQAVELPGTWQDPSGPWADRITPIFSCLTSQAKTLAGSIVLYRKELPKGTTTLELGMPYSAESRTPSRPTFVLGALEGLKEGEALRATFDDQQAVEDIDTLQDMLDSDPAKRVLLQPNTTYTVTASYTAQSRDDETNALGPVKNHTQTFSFQTDADAPARLDPWLLTMTPVQAEGFHFYQDPLTLIFSTDDVLQLWKTYGRSLKGIVRASSFVSDTLPFSTLDPLPGSVLSPFEETLIEVMSDPALGKNCVKWHIQTRHGKAVMPFTLEPRTEYTFDVETDPATALPADARLKAPLFRRGFTTSRYPSLDAFAADLKAAYVGHRALEAGISLDPAFGTEGVLPDVLFAQALANMGLGALEAPSRTQLTVLWAEQSGAWKPSGLLIDAPEPLFRTREEPVKVVPDPNLPDEDYWSLAPAVWLELIEAGSSAVKHMVRTPAGARVMVVFAGSALGQTLSLALRRKEHALLDPNPTSSTPVWSVPLKQSPWED